MSSLHESSPRCPERLGSEAPSVAHTVLHAGSESHDRVISVLPVQYLGKPSMSVATRSHVYTHVPSGLGGAVKALNACVTQVTAGQHTSTPVITEH